MSFNQNLLALSHTKYGDIIYLQNDIYIASFYKNGQVPFQDIIDSVLKNYILNAKVVIDCGAHIGSHTIAYKHINPNLSIHSFEPQTIMYEILKLNINNLNLKSVYTYNCAVGNHVKNINIADKISDGPNSNEIINYNNNHNFGGVQIGKGNGEEKLMIKIDSLNLSACDFIKIDVEGFELPVIIGAINTIIKYKPVIFYESNIKSMTDDMAEIAEIPKDDGSGVFKVLSILGYNFAKVGDLDILALPN